MDTKRKVDESIALLNSLFAHPSKRHSAEKLPPPFNNASPASPSSAVPSPSADKALLIAARRQTYKPPRPAILDKLSRLAASRPTLHDSIAASIAASAPTSQLVPATPTEPIGAGTQSSDATSAQKKEAARKRYMPWSRDQFHERLETFKPSTWFDKPKMVNAVECAKRGWINTSDDRLECCGGCGGVVIVRIDLESDAARRQDVTDTDGQDGSSNAAVKSDFDFDLDDFISEQDIEVLGPKFHAMLTENHVAPCPWKTHPCDDNIYKFPVVSQSQARQDLLDRAQRLESIVSDPLISTVRHPLSVEQLEALEKSFQNGPSTKPLILSLFGWTTVEKQRVLSCQACHTQCTFISGMGSQAATTIHDSTTEDDGMGQDDEDDTAFDVVQSHKWYCYWINSSYDQDCKEGWLILYETVTAANRAKHEAETATTSGSSTPWIQPSDAVAQIRRMLRGQIKLPSS
ncbi:hypothetical protein BGZ70_003169 [Mortierella alpina]|uniref:C3HC-type domain-containing protein n=1 Tax=Mortierella alpina TaxID=64518 RepID=A0A9P6IUN1_MORAP|nr:hypothetical protein BGZ70_003169 [Mortierella alpina]